MSGISTGIGLISGIDTASLIEQLIAIDSRPVQTLQNRVTAIDGQRTALLGISAQLLSVRNAITNLHKASFFRRFNAQSSNESAITAAAGESAAPGSYSFAVRSLVSSHALLSRGFGSRDSAPVGSGTLSIEVGNGRINKSTDLEQLNGGLGVRRGVIAVTDRAGNRAEIDLRNAVTVDDVLTAINTAAGINVKASVTGVPSGAAGGDRLVLEDLNDAEAAGTLFVEDLNGGHAAEDLGLVGGAVTSAGRIDGADIVRLSNDTPLSLLNDGNGVDRLFDGIDLSFASDSGTLDFDVSLSGLLASRLDTRLTQLNGGNGVRLGKIEVTDRAGNSGIIDLGGDPAVLTVSDLIQRFNAEAQAAGVDVSATVVNSNISISDNTGIDLDDAPPLTITDVAGDDGTPGHAAADLGIDGEFENGAVTGNELLRMSSVGDLLRAINEAPNNPGAVRAEVSADGNGIVLIATGLEGYTVQAGEGSFAAADLGIDGATISAFGSVRSDTLLAGMNTVLLDTINGGAGTTLGEVSLTDRNGATSGTIDLSTARTLQDVVDLINAQAPVDADGRATISVSVDAVGTGLVVRDSSGGTGPLRITDVSGSLAADLNIAGDHEENEVASGNLQRQYVSRQTLLSELNGNAGVTPGAFRITDSTGFVHIVDLPGSVRTLGDVIDAINRITPDQINARINDTGDGLLIEDFSDGTLSLTITDEDGDTAATDLGIAGTADANRNYIDGTLETHIDIAAGDSLIDVVRKINESGGNFSAAIVNDGGAINPYSLSITSGLAGRRGELVIDGRGIDLGFDTLSAANDAVVAVGGAGAVNPILVTSDSNTLDEVIDGVTLDLHAVTDDPVTIDVAQDIDGVVESIRSFINAYNEVQDTIDDLTSVDPEAEERGVLQGDRTVNTIRDRLYRAVTSRVTGVDPQFQRLFSVGITFGADNKLEFDETKFRDAYDAEPEKVEALFTQEETGIGPVLQETLEELTRDFDGVISRRDALLQDQQTLLNDRIDDLNILLDARRARLEAQFVAMERALADLQGQQTALNQLAGLTA